MSVKVSPNSIVMSPGSYSIIGHDMHVSSSWIIDTSSYPSFERTIYNNEEYIIINEQINSITQNLNCHMKTCVKARDLMTSFSEKELKTITLFQLKIV